MIDKTRWDQLRSQTPSGSTSLAKRALYTRGMGFGGWLEEQLFDRRIVLVTGRLGDDAAAKAAAALLSLVSIKTKAAPRSPPGLSR